MNWSIVAVIVSAFVLVAAIDEVHKKMCALHRETQGRLDAILGFVRPENYAMDLFHRTGREAGLRFNSDPKEDGKS